MARELSRVRVADRLVAGGAISLLVFVFFFDWFGEGVSGTLPDGELSGLGGSSTGWDTFTVSRWVWLATIVVALASVVAVAGARRLPGVARPGEIVALLGAVSTVLIVYRIAYHPEPSVGFAGFHATHALKPGIWLGLIAALAITAGGYLQMRQAAPLPPDGPGDPAQAGFSGLTLGGDATRSSPAREGQAPPPPLPDAG